MSRTIVCPSFWKHKLKECRCFSTLTELMSLFFSIFFRPFSIWCLWNELEEKQASRFGKSSRSLDGCAGRRVHWITSWCGGRNPGRTVTVQRRDFTQCLDFYGTEGLSDLFHFHVVIYQKQRQKHSSYSTSQKRPQCKRESLSTGEEDVAMREWRRKLSYLTESILNQLL